jgi:hypothetical protein
MHFKRNLWLSMMGAAIIIIAILFGSQQSEANHGTQHNLPQINKVETSQESMPSKELNAPNSYFDNGQFRSIFRL